MQIISCSRFFLSIDFPYEEIEAEQDSSERDRTLTAFRESAAVCGAHSCKASKEAHQQAIHWAPVERGFDRD
jgi:hypothetical protein